MRQLLLTLMMVTAFACSEQETETSTNPHAGVAGASDEDSGLDQEPVAAKAEALDGACAGSVVREEARLNCKGWDDQGDAVYGFNCAGNENLSRAFKIQRGAPAGKVWFKVYKRELHPGSPVDEGYSFVRYDQCSCTDSGPCTQISAFAPESEPDLAPPTPNTYAAHHACSDHGWSSINRAIATANHQWGCDPFKWDNSFFTETFNNNCYWNGKARAIRIAYPVNIGESNWCAYRIERSKSGPNTDKCRWKTAQCDWSSSNDCLLSDITSSGSPANCVGYN